MMSNSFLKRALLSSAALLSGVAATAHAQSNYSVSDRQLCQLNANGELNCIIGDSALHLSPPPELPALRAVTTGEEHACGITVDGDLVCWGRNFFGQLAVPDLDLPLEQINAGQHHTCAVDTAGEAHFGYRRQHPLLDERYQATFNPGGSVCRP